MKTLLITIILATNVLNLEIASTRAQKEKGLMFRKNWNTADGMIFINKNPSPVTYWMKNTYLNLAIYFLDRDLNILETYNPAPLSVKLINSASDDVKYVLELNTALTDTLNASYPVFRKKLREKLDKISPSITIED
jgi:hypothetical protein